MTTSIDSKRRWAAGKQIGRALLRTLRCRIAAGTLGATLSASFRARTLAFVEEPTFAELLAERARQQPSHEFLRFEDQRLTLGELDARVNAVCAGLGALARPGDNVAIMSPNCPAFLEAFFAVQRLGLGTVPVNTALVGDGLAHVLTSSKARVIFVHRELLPQLEQVRSRLPDLEHVVLITEGDEVDGSLEAMRRDHRGAAPPSQRPDPDAVALLMYTSGTTGSAKGVVYRYRDSNTKRLRLLSHLLYEPGEVLYTCLPLFHANALLLTTVMALDMGASIGLGRRFSASRFWQEMSELGGTSFNALGAMIPILLKQPAGEFDRNHRVRLVVSAACPTEVWRPFEERFGLRLVEAYGAVDGGGFITMNLGNAPVRIDRQAAGRQVPPGDRGRRRAPAGNAGGALDLDRQAPRALGRVLPRRQGDRGQTQGRLDLHRRSLAPRRTGQSLLRRAPRRLDAAPRGERLGPRGGERDRRAPRRARVRGVRRAQ